MERAYFVATLALLAAFGQAHADLTVTVTENPSGGTNWAFSGGSGTLGTEGICCFLPGDTAENPQDFHAADDEDTSLSVLAGTDILGFTEIFVRDFRRQVPNGLAGSNGEILNGIDFQADGLSPHDDKSLSELDGLVIYADDIDLSSLKVGTYTFDSYYTGGSYYTSLGTFTLNVLAPSIPVAIDVKPGSDRNCFNINGHGVIPVAILGGEDLDVTGIDLTSLSFSGLEVRMRGNKGPLCSVEYSNADAYLDLVCHFEDDPAQWQEGTDDTATLTAVLLDGTHIEGTDSICVVPQQKHNK